MNLDNDRDNPEPHTVEDASLREDLYMVAPGDTTGGHGTVAESNSVDNPQTHNDNTKEDVVTGSDVNVTLFNKMGVSIPVFRNYPQDENGKFRPYSTMQNEAKNWLHKAENVCKLYKIPEEQRVWAVTNKLDGTAYDWYIGLEMDPKFDPADWNFFKKRFIEAFCPDSSETQFVDDFKVLSLKHNPNEPVAKYIAEFNNVRKLLLHKEHPRHCIARFLLGLKEELKNYVLNFKPETIESAMKLAQQGEELLGKTLTTSHGASTHVYKFESGSKRPGGFMKKKFKRFKKSTYSKPMYKPVDKEKTTSTYVLMPPPPVVVNPVEDMSQSDTLTDAKVVGHLLKMDLAPQQVKPKLCSALVNGTYHRSLLIDTGSTTDVVSYDTVNQLGCVDKIVRYSEVKRAAIIKDFVNVVGYIPLEIALTLNGTEIKETRSFFVLDTDQDLFILGLPFVKTHGHLISLSDLVDADLDNFKTFDSTKVEVNVFDYTDEYVNKIVRKSENQSFLGYIYSLSTDEIKDNVIDVEIDTPQVNQMREFILKDFADVVTEEPPTNLPPQRRHQHRIILADPKKVSGRNQYPLSFSEKQELTKQVEKLLQQGFIRESSSPFNSPVLFVRKKDKSLRMCVDFRLLNNNTVKDKFPLPQIEQLISRFGQAKVYSKLDLMSGYYQVRIAENDIEKTAFSTDYGHYEWVVMPFGLTNAPATFQRMMNTVLKDYLNKFVQVYLDDIFIYSNSYDEHYKHIRMVLNTLRKNKLIAKKSKCAFFFEELRFLGHVITPNGIRTDPEKIEKVKNWPTPKTIKDAQMFLGLTSYYRKFIENHSKIANPIHKFITKESSWTKSQDLAFESLKEALVHSPTLVHPDWSEHCTFVVHTDACGTSLGYTLEQLDAEGKLRGVIAYGSKKLVGSQLNYGIYDREFLAVVEALKTWRYYLLGRRFIIRTDHKSLIYLKHQNLIDSARVARWLDYLAQYDFEIQYISGKSNSAADALSRYPYDEKVRVHCFDLCCEKLRAFETISVNSMGTVTNMEVNKELKIQIIGEYKKDEFYGEIYDILKNKKPVPTEIHHHIKHYEYKDEVLYYRTLLSQPCTRVVIPSRSALVNKLIRNAHCGVDAGHFGTFKTYLNLADTFFWKNMLPSIRKFCNRCQVCQRNNTSTQKLQGLFMPLPVPEGRWTDVSMDFVTGLPKTASGYDMIMVIVDRFSKMAHFIPTDKSLTAERCARLFVECCLKHHGVPRRLVSDKDIRFMNRFWYTIHFLFGTSLLFSTTNHPQTDGQSERVNKVLNHLLRKHCSNDMLNWDHYLPIVEFAYNSTYQDSIKDVPFRLGIGYVPDSMKKVSYWKIDDNRFSPSAEEYMRRMAITLQQAQDNIVEAQRSQEKNYNQHRRPHEYKVGDYILLHRDARGVESTYVKIQPVFYGPYRLVKQINDNTFEVDLPSMNKKDRIMNVQWFKPYRHQQDLFRQPPRTDRETLARINEMCGIGGVDYTNGTYDVIWRDCDPRHATTISASQFNTASESLRTSLLHQARCLCAHELRA